ncbi:phosphotransferase, partial [Haloferax mucosum ATCC BAA-1512]
WNEKNSTVRVEFADGGETYLKVASDGDGSRIARERAVIPYVAAHTDVPVPALAASATGGAVPYLATAPVDGPNLIEVWADAPDSRRVELAREVGASLARVHDLRFETHGVITGGDATSLELDSGPWTDVLVETIADMRDLAPAERFDHHFDEVTQAVVENRETLDSAPAALLHGDVAQPNCFHTESGVGVLDWEIAHVGDPARDLYRAKVQLFDSLRSVGPAAVIDAFYDGYRSVAGGLPNGYEARKPIYEAVRFLGVSGFFDKYAEFRDEDEEALAEWVAVEMTRLLGRIEPQ